MPRLDFFGVVVSDMARAISFYRRLGLEFPEGAENEQHVEAPLAGELRYALDTEDVIEGVLSHAEHLALPRDTPLKKALFACDELSGFVHACGLVRPTGLDGLEPKSVKKKLKQPSFAAGVHRDEVYRGAEELGVDLDEHIRTVVEALQPIAAELGLPSATQREP